MSEQQSWRIEVPEIAERLGVSERVVYRYLRDGVIPCARTGDEGKAVVVHRAEFEKWLVNGREPKVLTPEQIEIAAYEGVKRALAEFQPVVRFEPAQMRVVQPIKARRA